MLKLIDIVLLLLFFILYSDWSPRSSVRFSFTDSFEFFIFVVFRVLLSLLSSIFNGVSV